MNTAKKKSVAKRDLFAELSNGFAALAKAREGKQTLRTHTEAFKPAPKVTARYVINLRKKLGLSRPVFATYLRTKVRTIESWEQGRAEPNAQAALLLSLVDRFPDTVQRLSQI